jgi:hypothetical protein
MAIRNHNYICDEINSKLNSINFCYFPVQNPLFYHILIKNVSALVCTAKSSCCSL